MSLFDDVGAFHRKFGVPSAADDRPPHHLDSGDFIYRFKFLLEELAEYADAQTANGVAAATRKLRDQIDDLVAVLGINPSKVNLAESLDALVDLAWIAIGTAHFHHFPFDEAWAEVRRANMEKERGPTAARGHALDIRKPAGWKPPDLASVIERRRKFVEDRRR